MEQGTAIVADLGMLDFTSWCGERATFLVKSEYGELTTRNTNIAVLTPLSEILLLFYVDTTSVHFEGLAPLVSRCRFFRRQGGRA